MTEEYRPTLMDMVSEMSADIGRKTREFGRRVSDSFRSTSMQAFDQNLPKPTEATRRKRTGFFELIERDLAESYDNTLDFTIGFVHDGLEVLIFPYMIPSAHRLDSLELAKKWRKYVPSRISDPSGNANWAGHHEPDTMQRGGIFGTLAALGLTVAEGIVYYKMARKGYPNVLVIAVPFATNVFSGLYEYGANIRQKLIQKHSQNG